MLFPILKANEWSKGKPAKPGLYWMFVKRWTESESAVQPQLVEIIKDKNEDLKLDLMIPMNMHIMQKGINLLAKWQESYWMPCVRPEPPI